MKRFSQQFHSEATKIKLTKAESDALRERVVSFMEYHPRVAASPTPRKIQQRTEAGPFFIFKVPSRFVFSGFVAMGVMILVVMPVMAEQAVPGDVLYPVKISINEEVMSTLNRDPYEKVAWETTRIERRLAETRLLAEEGKLTPEVEADMVAAVAEHSAKATETIDEIRSEDADQAALAEMAFAARLTVEDALLDTAAAEASSVDQTGSVARIAASVNEKREAALLREDAADVSFERLLSTMEAEIGHLYEALETIADDADGKMVAEYERRIQDLERRVNEAAGINGAEPEVAKESLKEIWKDAQKLVRYGNDLSVRRKVSLEALVPVVLTEAERQEALSRSVTNIEMNTARISAGVATLEDPAIQEKTEYGLTLIGPLREELSLRIAANDLAGAEQLVAEIDSLIDSLLSLADYPPMSELPTGSSTATSTGTTTAPETGSTTASTTPVASGTPAI